MSEEIERNCSTENLPSGCGHKVEFDDYASAYDEGMDSSVRRCVGGGSESFIEIKVDWLLRRCQRLPHNDANGDFRLLDYGCGIGTMLKILVRRGFSGDIVGCDVSREMLKQATKRWDAGPLPLLRPMEDILAPFGNAEFDLVVVSSVLHHVPVDQRERTYADIKRLLKPGGHVCVFEHNPYNPVTQWVVRHAPIDKNAVLLRPDEVRAGLVKAGASRVETEYIMFLPPRLKLCRLLDRVLYWLPLGGQYVVFAAR